MTIINDIKFGLRLLAKSPGYAVTVILILGLGIGGTTLMFSVINTVLLKPLPYVHADRLVRIYETVPKQGDCRGPAGLLYSSPASGKNRSDGGTEV